MKRARPVNIIIYLILYSVSRFFLEYLRYDFAERGIWKGLSTSQWLSIIICFSSAICLTREKILSSKHSQTLQ